MPETTHFNLFKFIITITSNSIAIDSSNLQPNNWRYGEEDARKIYCLNLYPIMNHGSCNSQYLIWPFWNPYFQKAYFTIYTIHLVNLPVFLLCAFFFFLKKYLNDELTSK
jgi:hypothetical protein